MVLRTKVLITFDVILATVVCAVVLVVVVVVVYVLVVVVVSVVVVVVVMVVVVVSDGYRWVVSVGKCLCFVRCACCAL